MSLRETFSNKGNTEQFISENIASCFNLERELAIKQGCENEMTLELKKPIKDIDFSNPILPIYKEGVFDHPIAMYFISDDLIIATDHYYNKGKVSEYRYTFFTKTKEKLQEFYKKYRKLAKITEKKNKKEPQIYVTMGSRMELVKYDLKNIDIDWNLHFNEGTEELHHKLVKTINEEDSSFSIFTGVPGVGKTTFIKNLTKHVNKKVIFVSPRNLLAVTETNFLEMRDDIKGSLIIIEDAEQALKDRSQNSNAGLVSNLLNITDGLLSEVCKLHIICTTNSNDHIDDALKRTGRLTAFWEFRELDNERAKNLLHKLGKKDEGQRTVGEIMKDNSLKNGPLTNTKMGF